MNTKPQALCIVITMILIGAVAGCNSAKCVEKPIADCVCTMDYNPVCGCNDKTYSNACAAECAGINTYAEGPCHEKS